MQRRRDNDLWALPGGTHGPRREHRRDRSPRGARGNRAHVEIDGIVGIYSDPRHLIEYSDGEVRQQFNICFRGRLIDGTLRAQRRVNRGPLGRPGELDELPIHHTTRLRLQHFLESRDRPFIG